MNKSACTEMKSSSHVKVHENGKKAVFVNELRKIFAVTQIDNCLVKEGARADYLVSKPEVASVIVELKGKNVQHACEQIFSSMENDSVRSLIKGRCGALIVCSKYPRFDSFLMRAKSDFARKYKGGLHIASNSIVCDIENIVKIAGK